MNTKTLILLILCLLLVPSIYAAKTLDQHNVELTPQENITFNLEENSYVKVRTHEGSTITVNVENSVTSFTLTNIQEDGTAEITIKGLDSKEVNLPLGEKPLQVPIKSAIPIIYIENAVYHDDDNEADRNVVLRLTIPVVNKFNPNNKAVSNASDIPQEPAQKDPYLKYFLIAIILLLVIIIILGPKPKKNPDIPSNAPEPKAEVKETKIEPKTETKESKPKAKKTKKKVKEEQRSEDLPDQDEK